MEKWRWLGIELVPISLNATANKFLQTDRGIVCVKQSKKCNDSPFDMRSCEEKGLWWRDRLPRLNSTSVFVLWSSQTFGVESRVRHTVAQFSERRL